MSDPFLDAIADRPDDDLPRLVYADYLDESGDPARAEFIRIQIELAKGSNDELRRREQTLLKDHGASWRVPDVRGGQQFSRGFVESIEISAEMALAHGERLVESGPIRHVRLATAGEHLERLADLPYFTRLETLDLSNAFASGQRLAAFLNSARLDRLQTLRLRNCRIWAEGVEAIVATPVTRQLRELDLSGNPFGDDGARAIAAAANLSNLEALLISAREQPLADCIQHDGATALAESASLRRLRHLDLSEHSIGNGGLHDLVVDSSNATTWERLDAAYNDIGMGDDRGIEALVAARHLVGLRHLNLSGNAFGVPAAQALANWSQLEWLQVVDLTNSEITPQARALLIASPYARKFLL